ncbi:MAG: hypothetical protein ACOYBL_12190 [Lachnospiraceae bacterium]|jgi:hypothetical protein
MNEKNNTKQIPLSVALSNIRRDLSSVLNESGLHICILDMVVSGLYTEIHDLANKQSALEMKDYEKSKENKTKNKDV